MGDESTANYNNGIPGDDMDQDSVDAILDDEVTISTRNTDDDEDEQRRRRRLLEFCRKHQPSNVAFCDCVRLIDTCMQMGILNIHDDHVYNTFLVESFDYEVDHNGRIVVLHIDPRKVGFVFHDDPQDEDEEATLNDDDDEEVEDDEEIALVESQVKDNNNHNDEDERVAAAEHQETIVNDRIFDLHYTIVRLEKLQRLELNHCRSISANLSQLQDLHEIRLFRCCLNRPNFVPVSLELPNVKLFFVGGMDDAPNENNSNQNQADDPQQQQQQQLLHTSNFISWLVTNVPNLETLYCGTLNRRDTEHIINRLIREYYDNHDTRNNNNGRLYSSLHKLAFCNCRLDDVLVEKIVAQVVPTFSNLTTVDLGRNTLQSLASICHRTLPTTLRVFDVIANPIFTNIITNMNPNTDTNTNTHPKELQFILNFLKCNRGIYNLGGIDCIGYRYSPAIRNALLINHGGRYLLDTTVDQTTNDGNHDDDRCSYSILPRSIWPIVLARSYQKSNAIYNFSSGGSSDKLDGSGVYYLLQQIGPILMNCRRSLIDDGDNWP